MRMKLGKAGWLLFAMGSLGMWKRHGPALPATADQTRIGFNSPRRHRGRPSGPTLAAPTRTCVLPCRTVPGDSCGRPSTAIQDPVSRRWDSAAAADRGSRRRQSTGAASNAMLVPGPLQPVAQAASVRLRAKSRHRRS